MAFRSEAGLTSRQRSRMWRLHRGALRSRAEIIPVNLIWIMPAKGGVMRSSLSGPVCSAPAQRSILPGWVRGSPSLMRIWKDGQPPLAQELSARGFRGWMIRSSTGCMPGAVTITPQLIADLAEAGETETGYRRAGAMLVSGDRGAIGLAGTHGRQRADPPWGTSSRCPRRGTGAVSAVAGWPGRGFH